MKETANGVASVSSREWDAEREMIDRHRKIFMDRAFSLQDGQDEDEKRWGMQTPGRT
jgi:hypothetical protein